MACFDARSSLLARRGRGGRSAVGISRSAQAADKVVKIGLDLSLTGARCARRDPHRRTARMMAIEEANAKHVVKGVQVQVLTARRRHRDGRPVRPGAGRDQRPQVGVRQGRWSASIGPQMSGAGKAMAPILSQGNMPMITPSSTNPDMTDPKFAAQYRPAGKPIFFRTVATDAYQGPNMANYYADTLKVKSVYVLDDTGAYGEGLADAFQGQAEKKGIKVLGRDKLDPKAADYSAVLTKIKSLNPDALYYGGVLQAGVKLVKQAYDILPNIDERRRRRPVRPGNADRRRLSRRPRAGTPPTPPRTCTDDRKLPDWVKRFKATFKRRPRTTTRSSAYDAAHGDHRRGQEGADANGKPITHDTVRDALASRQARDAAGPGRVRRERRPEGQGRQRLPGQEERRLPDGRHAATVPNTSAWRRRVSLPPSTRIGRRAMTRQPTCCCSRLINGLSLGAMYALLALGFTLVYGILELINFSHFNVFMVGSFVGAVDAAGVRPVRPVGRADRACRWSACLVAAFVVTMFASGVLGVVIERVCLRPLRNVQGPAAMITTIGVSYVLFNLVLLFVGADAKNFPNPLPPMRMPIGGAVLRLREILIWVVSHRC